MSKTYIPVSVRRTVLEAQGHSCYVCGNTGNAVDLHHITPEYASGPTNADNLTPLCSNKLGANSCHIAAHALYRMRERQLKRLLTHTEYKAIVDTIRALSTSTK